MLSWFCIWCFSSQNSSCKNPTRVLGCKVTWWKIPLAQSMLHLHRAPSCSWTRCLCYLHRAADHAALWSGKNSARHFLAFKCPSCLVGSASCEVSEVRKFLWSCSSFCFLWYRKKVELTHRIGAKWFLYPVEGNSLGSFIKFLLQKCYLDVKETFCRFVKSKNFKLSSLLLCVIFFLLAGCLAFFWGTAQLKTQLGLGVAISQALY